MPAKKYHLSTEGTYDCDFVEGIGVDGIHSGLLFSPFVILTTGYSSSPIGLIKLTDLDGNVLYKGADFDFFSGIGNVHGKEQSMLIEQSGPSLRVALPADGMLSVIDMAGHVVISRVVTQGATEVSTASLAAGVYLVQLSTPAGIQTAKVVVK